MAVLAFHGRAAQALGMNHAFLLPFVQPRVVLGLIACLVWSWQFSAGATVEPDSGAAAIICPQTATFPQRLAAHEIRRYVYLRTGRLLPVLATAPDSGDLISLQVDQSLGNQSYSLKTTKREQHNVLQISGGSDAAVLYGAYALAEKLGVRFYVHGDVIPDERIPFVLPDLNETQEPLFALRGLQPFHDFPEGPDWWTLDDWKAVLSQVAKMRMNFIGLHTYPFQNKDLGPEPTVWIGLPEDVMADGTVRRSDVTTWYNTQKFQPYGCYRPEKTSAYSFGGADVFPSDNYGSEVNGPDDFPFPKTPVASVALMNRAGKMLRAVFEEAHRLGVKTCVGTESPLDIPDVVKARLNELGLKLDDPATLQRLYEGMFLRIQHTYPIDYYWIWGHEGEIDQARFILNLQCARAALSQSQAPFGLGVCGWGWITGNFPDLDGVLPKDVAFSAINMSVGNSPVSPNFGRLEGRAKWAIPWFEDDPGLSSPQLWVGRMRKDAVDARTYRCTGLMGLHWRTRILAPNIAALAQAAWNQGDWSRPVPEPTRPTDIEVLGGKTAAFLNSTISGTEDSALYQTVRFDLQGYRFAVPNGAYTVTLRFCEPAYKAAGKRVFGVNLQGKEVLRGLDVFARVGANKALDYSFDSVAVTNGQVRVEFVPEVEFPCVAAIEVVGPGATRKVNCGGPAYNDFAADPAPKGEARYLPVADFYQDWAQAEVGPEVASAVAEIFTRLDGKFPRASDWNQGPGVLSVNRQPWARIAPQFDFVEAMGAQGNRVRGAGNRERFDWWLNTFRYARAMAQAGCVRGALDQVMERIQKDPNPTEQKRWARDEALPLREQLVRVFGELYGHLLATLHNASELGTLVNAEQQWLLRTRFLTVHDARLEQLLGEPLPVSTQLPKTYGGEPRLIVLTARGSAAQAERLSLPIIALDRTPVQSVEVKVRPLGQGEWRTITARHMARAVYRAELPPAMADFEYYVQARTDGGQTLRWPAAAPERNQTVVVEEQ
jgi:hypothetical protein